MTGLGLIFVMALGRGSLHGLISAYLQAGTVVSAESGKILGNIFQYGLRFLWEFWPFFLLTIFAFVVLWRAENRCYWHRALFWLACSLAPLVEIVSKMAFLYHFSMLFPAFAGMLALSFRLQQDPAFLQRLLKVRMLLLASLIVLCVNYRPVALQETWKIVQDFPECRWSNDASGQSNTLLAGKVIESLPGRTLSVSGFMHFLYPLTRRQPPCLGMDDLSRVFLHLGRDTKKFADFLAEHAADVLVIGKVQEANHVAMFTEEIQQAVAASGLYTLVADIPVDEEKNYGWIGCFIYQKIQ
ncbi:MAG: hypothetical protein K6G15_09510 [Desulfovibrio sp.]|nr:hypothetical protein [Desulfovibrio sp.]